MDTISIPCLYLNNGKDVEGYYFGVSDEDAPKDGGTDPIAKAEKLCAQTDAQGLMIFDFSEEKSGHAASLEMIKAICRNTQMRVFAAGAVHTADDVKDYLSAGCARVILNSVKDSNREILADVSRRFGKKRIGVYVSDYNDFLMQKEDIEKLASMILTDRDDDDDEKIVEETELAVLLHDDQQSVCLEANYRKKDFESEVSWKDLKLNSDGMIPCVVQDFKTDKVLMVAYMNEEAFLTTLRTGRMTYWSRSRQELWMKGLTSGHFQYLKELRLDCDNDTLLAKVAQVGAACHTGHYSCFYRTIVSREESYVPPTHVLQKTFDAICEQRNSRPVDAESTEDATKNVLQKLGADDTALILEAAGGTKSGIIDRVADVLYDSMMLMAEKGLTWEDVAAELAEKN